VPGAVAVIVRVYADPAIMLPRAQVRLLPLKVAVPTGAVPKTAGPVKAAGNASNTVTFGTSRPATGPLPKMRRHT
jgi:hypothetical protein